MQATIDRLFLQAFDRAPTERTPMAGDGSQRRMIRVGDGADTTAIAVIGPDSDENRAFLSFSATFKEMGLPVPEVYASDEDAGIYLLEDLGDTTLFDALTSESRDPAAALSPKLTEIYERVLTWLPRFQIEGGTRIDYSVAHPRASFDRQALQWDLNYFKYHFLKLARIPFHESRLEDDFGRLTAWLSEAEGGHFMYRDFQSRNVMLRSDASGADASGAWDPWFIDYQGGMRGPLQYDVAKLLHEGKAGLPAETRTALLNHYLDVLATHTEVDRERFLSRYRGFVFLRIMQGMGAYGYLGLYGRKPQFLARIPHAVRDIEALLASGFLPIELPELQSAFDKIVASDALRSAPVLDAAGLAGFTVRVGSFSYKHGVPEDPGGHGGGFVFDCRALPNPGRLVEYAGLSGLDPAVPAWLATQPDVDPFYESARSLVVAQIKTYLARGFDSLSVQFGCTGGQHRSVTLAERLGHALREAYPGVDIPIRHAESVHWPVTAARVAPPARANA